MKVSMQFHKEPDDKSDYILSLQGVNYYAPSSIVDHLRLVLSSARAVWPEADVLKDVYIVDLKDKPKT